MAQPTANLTAWFNQCTVDAMTPGELMLMGACLGLLVEVWDEMRQMRREREANEASRWIWKR